MVRFTIDVFYFKQDTRPIQYRGPLAVTLKRSRERHQGAVPALLPTAALSCFSFSGDGSWGDARQPQNPQELWPPDSITASTDL